MIVENLKKGVKNLRFLTTLIPQQYVTATCLILRQLASNNSHLPLFPTVSLVNSLIFFLFTTIILLNLVKRASKITVGNKGKWLLFEVSCLYIRQVAITCCCSTSVVRNLKFFTSFFVFLIIIINIILSTNRSYVISPCDTNRVYT